MEDIRQEIDAVLNESAMAVHLLLENALAGKKVKIRNVNIVLGKYHDNVNLLVGKVEAVIGCKTGNLSDGMLVTLLVEVDSGGSSNALLEVECFHRNIIVLDSE